MLKLSKLFNLYCKKPIVPRKKKGKKIKIKEEKYTRKKETNFQTKLLNCLNILLLFFAQPAIELVKAFAFPR